MDTDKRPPTGKLLRGIPERMGYQHHRAVVIIVLVEEKNIRTHKLSARVNTAFDSIFSAALAAVLLTHRLEIRAAACANRESVAGFIDIIVIVMLVFEKVHEETKKVLKI